MKREEEGEGEREGEWEGGERKRRIFWVNISEVWLGYFVFLKKILDINYLVFFLSSLWL